VRFRRVVVPGLLAGGACLAGGAPARIAAQSAWGDFEVELLGAVGRYEDQESPDEPFRGTASVRVHATVFRYAFVELERTKAAWQFAADCPVFLVGQVSTHIGPDGCTYVDSHVSHITMGGGAQLPLGRFRLYAVADRFRLGTEYRRRYERQATRTDAWTMSPEWTVALTIAFR